MTPIAKRPRTPALGFIIVTLILDVLGFGLLIPVAPRLVEQLLHSGPEHAESEAAPYVAWLQSTYYAMSFLFAPLLGVLSDRFGRRPVILISMLGSGIDYFAMALAPSVGFLFVTRVINGLSGGSITAATAYIADVTPPERRAASFGVIGAAFGIGFVIGPVLGGILGSWHLRLPFYVAGVLTLANWLYGWFILPESLPKNLRAPMRWHRANPLGATVALKKYPLVFWMAISLFLLNMAQFALHATWALAMQYRFDWSPWQIGLSLMAVGIGAAIVQGKLARTLIPALGEKRALILGLVIGVLAYLGYGAATAGWMIYAVVAFASLGAISQPAGQSIVTRSVKANEQGTVQGALASLTSLSGVIGPLVGGYIFAYVTREGVDGRQASVSWVGANFYMSAALALCGGIAALRAIQYPIGHESPSEASGGKG